MAYRGDHGLNDAQWVECASRIDGKAGSVSVRMRHRVRAIPMLASFINVSEATVSAVNLRRWNVAAGLFCCLMLVLHLDAGWHCAGITDFWRDMYWATRIAHAEAFPLAGPPINQVAELGPWWYYLLSLPIALTGRLAAAALLIQILAAMKYFLAWRIGTRWLDARFGFAFAVSMAVAGWSTAAFAFPSHPALVETTVLLLAMATWRMCTRLGVGNALWFGLAAAACLHAHPTTLPYLAFAGVAILWRHRSMAALGWLGMAGLLVLLSLLPPFLDPMPASAMWQRTLSDYTINDIGNHLGQRLPKLGMALIVGGAWMGLLLLTSWKLAAVKWAWWAYCACLALACAGIVSALRMRRLRQGFVVAAILLFAQIAFIAFVRGWTTIWMVPSCLVPLAFLVATGWYGGLAASKAAVRTATLVALLPFTFLSLAPFEYFLRTAHVGRTTPEANPFHDIVEWGETYAEVAVSPLAAHSIDTLGALLCEPATLHARLATAIERSLATSARNACGYWPDLRFGGMRAGVHLAGIPQRLVDLVGIEPEHRIGGLALYSKVRVIAPAQGAQRTALARMQVSIDAELAASSQHDYAFETNPDDVVVLTNRMPIAMGMTVVAVEANGEPARLLYDERSWQIYRCATCASAKANWHLRIDGAEANVDLVVLEKSKSP